MVEVILYVVSEILEWKEGKGLSLSLFDDSDEKKAKKVNKKRPYDARSQTSSVRRSITDCAKCLWRQHEI